MADGVPWHALVVHGPLMVGVLAPVIGLLIWGAIALRQLHHRAWWLTVVLYLIAFGGALIAVETGEDEHDRVHDVVAEEPMHLHEERGEQYRLALGIVFAMAIGAGLLFGNRAWGMRMAGATLAAGFLAAYLAVGVGHSGGLLVYREGAAAYYVEPPAPSPRAMRAAPEDSVMARDTAGTGHDHDDHEH